MVFLILMFSSLWAYNGALEWSSYTPSELKVSNGFSSIDSEYVSDQLAYTHPIRQEFVWNNGGKMADFTFGSISSDKFLYQGRINLLTKITEDWSFEYVFFEQKNFELNQANSWLGVSYKPKPWFSMGVYGTPESNKGIIDYKLKSSLFFDESVFSLYLINSDYMKNSKSIDNKKYITKPSAYGFKWLSGKKDDFFILQGRIDPMSQLEGVSGDSSEVKYSALQMVLQTSFLNRVWRLKSETSKFYEQNNVASTITWAEQNINEIRIETQKYGLLFGALWKQFDWGTDQGELKHDNYLPYLSFSYIAGGLFQNLTYELTSHESDYKGIVDRSSTDCSSCFEQRFNYELTKEFNSNFTFTFKFTFDIDEFGTANTWEGGSGQFYLKF